MLGSVGRSYALLLTEHHSESGDCEASDLQRSCAMLLTQAHFESGDCDEVLLHLQRSSLLLPEH